MPASFYQRIAEELDVLRQAGQYRVLREIAEAGSTEVCWQGRRYVNLAGNDYLGLAADRDWRNRFYAECRQDTAQLGLSAASSRLLTGNHPFYGRLERSLGALYNNRAVLILNSGYHANLGILPAISRKGDLILADKLNHASLIDGLQLCQADYRRYRHLDYRHLEQLLSEARRNPEVREIFIVSESVFSMDGDLADLRHLAELRERYRAVLVLDEAHAVGVFGPAGAGLAEAQGVLGEVDFLVGTLGKAFGSAGAYVVTEPAAREYLVNKMRPLIFTTGLPPVVVAWTDFVVRHLPELAGRRDRVRQLAQQWREVLEARRLATGGNSQIVPLVAGSNPAAVALAERFQQAGILVFAIRPPTVPPGTARLRFSFSATLDDDVIARMADLV